MYYTSDFSKKKRFDALFFEKRISNIRPLCFKKRIRLTGWTINGKHLNIGERIQFKEDIPLIITGKFRFEHVDTNELAFLDVWAGGETLVKVDGKPYGEINERHELLRIDDLMDGNMHEINLEVVPRYLSDSKKSISIFERSYFVLFNKEILSAFLDFKLAVEVYKVVEEPLKSIMHDVLLKAFELLEIPSNTKDYFKRMREDRDTIRLFKIWNPPDFPDEFENELDEEMVKSFKESSEFLMSEMEKLSKKFYEPLEIFISGHAHIDYAWLWPFSETRRKIIRTFSNVLNLMKNYSKFRFVQTSSAIYEDLKEMDEGMFEEVKRRIAEGRWEVIGGSVVEFDTNLISGESIIRQFLYGQGFFKDEFGKRCTVLFLPDSFGFTWSLPQLMKDAGMEYFITTKLTWNDRNEFPYRWFKWRGLDGTEIITNIFNGKHGYNSNLEPCDLIEHVNNWKERSQNIPYDILTFGYGDGGGGPTEEMLEYYERYEKMPKMPKLIMTNISRKLKELNLSELPIWDDELYLEIHRATYTTQSKMKKMNRELEHLMYVAELVSTLDYIKGGNYPENEFDKAWSVILRSQFHDILPGSSIKEVYDDMLDALNKVKNEMNEILFEKLNGFKIPNDANEKNTISIVNPMNFKLPIILKDVTLKEGTYGDLIVEKSKNGRMYLLCAKSILEPLSVNSYEYSENTNFESDLIVNEGKLENATLKVEIEDGKIRIYDKVRDREIVRSMSLKMIEDIPPNFEAWDVTLETSKIEDLILKDIEILDSGFVTSSLILKYKYYDSEIDMILRMYSGLRILDMEFDVDWHTRRRLLKLNIETDFLTRKVRNEIAFGYMERKTTRNTSFEIAKFEVPYHRWLEIGEDNHGLIIVNDSKYGFSAYHSEVSLSLLRGPVFPDFFSDEGKHHFEFRLIPHDGMWKEKALCHSALLNCKIPVIVGKIDDFMKPIRDIVEVKENPVLSAVKKRRGSDDVILRFVEAFGERVKLNFKDKVYRSNVLEDDSGIDLTSEIFDPFKVKTFIYKL